LLKAKSPQNFKEEEKTNKKSVKQERLNQSDKRDVTKLRNRRQSRKTQKKTQRTLLNL